MPLILLLRVLAGVHPEPSVCTYQTYRWNVPLRQAVDFETVRHPYADLTPDEIDETTGCTVCEEDQVALSLPPLKPFRICRHLADGIGAALSKLVRGGGPIREVTGYRVGRTRGEQDENGNRTGFSNHSYGIALDVNPERNGLYDRCPEFGPHCRLIRGGPWRPGQPGSWLDDSPLVLALRAIGLRWGGRIRGDQKDFMHFSPSGY